jgi:hypothetical protein
LSPPPLTLSRHVAADGYRLNTWLIDKPEAVPRFLTTALASSGGFGKGQEAPEGEEEEEEEAEEGAEPEPEAQIAEETGPIGRDAATAALENPALLAPMLERSVAIICLDLSKPWKVAQSLKTWMKVVSDETQAVIAKIDAVDKKAATRVRATLKERVQKAFYKQPPAEGEEAPAESASTAVQRVAGDSMAELGSTYEGVPLIVVPCKSDEIDDWPAKLNFEDAHIDYVKAHLRKLCLECGAGLVYTSAKKNSNIDTLRSYVLSRAVPGKAPPPLNDESTALDQTVTFVPAGTDTVKKIDSLLEATFGASHPAQPMALTGKTTMYPKLEQHAIAEIKRLARENPDLQQSYENDSTVTTEAMVSAVKNWVSHAIDGAIGSAPSWKEPPPEHLSAEVNRVLGLGLATEGEKGAYIPMAPEEAAKQDGSKAINVEDFFLKLRAAAVTASSFEWVVMDPNSVAKQLDEPMDIVDDQAFLEKVNVMAPEKDVTGSGRSVRAMPTSAASPSRASGGKSKAAAAGGGGGGGDDLKSNAADFFANLGAQGGGKAKGGAKKVHKDPTNQPTNQPTVVHACVLPPLSALCSVCLADIGDVSDRCCALFLLC